KNLGQLQSDEMYGFVPALALGGPVELKNLQKVKTTEHLMFLSQLSPLQDWGFPDV
ncbi:T6SS immunity protein Tdi1 domain-containing protein, partial [Pseudomonas savastanoi]